MRILRALIVDDEKPARRRLLELLQDDPRVEVAGVCEGGEEALAVLRQARAGGAGVDLVLLDVQMPEMNGFEVLDAIYRELPAAERPVVVFVTAYDQYALRAFDAHAVDYLLKPFSDERFEAALQRALRFVWAGQPEAVVAHVQALLDDVRRAQASPPDAPATPGGAAPPPLDRIVVKSRGRARLVRAEDVQWIEAEGVYVKLHTAREMFLHRELLGTLEARLDPRRFVRIHRSYLVNIDFVEELMQDSHGEYTVLLRDRTMLKLSRTYRARLQERLGQPL